MNIETGTVYKLLKKTMYLCNCSSYKSFTYPGSPPKRPPFHQRLAVKSFTFFFYGQARVNHVLVYHGPLQIATELGSGWLAIYFHCGVPRYGHWVQLDAS